MSEKITSKNLDEVIRLNKQIADQIREYTDKIQLNLNGLSVRSSSQLALHILKENGLVLMPVENMQLNGAIYVRDGKKIPYINTAQPRANQYFTAWHEVYHLFFDEISFDHVIGTDAVLEERKAEFFASGMLLGNLLSYYHIIPDSVSFTDKVLMCMDTFQAPYKAVLIKLYELAAQNNNEPIMRTIRDCFDREPKDVSARFVDLGLDNSLVEPSYVVNVAYLENKISLAKESDPDSDYHNDNQSYLEKIKQEVAADFGEALR